MGFIPDPLQKKQQIAVAPECDRVGPSRFEYLILDFPLAFIMLGNTDDLNFSSNI